MNKEDIIKLGKELEAERDAAHDLWTWLPSHKVAVKNHGDYADEHQPEIRDVMVEAAMFISCLKDGSARDYTLEEQNWFNRCPCGDDHAGE